MSPIYDVPVGLVDFIYVNWLLTRQFSLKEETEQVVRIGISMQLGKKISNARAAWNGGCVSCLSTIKPKSLYLWPRARKTHQKIDLSC